MNVIVNALDRRRGGADDNEAQAGHLIADTVRSHPRPGSNSNGALVAPALVKRYAKGTDSDATDALVAHTLRAEGFDASEDGTGRGTPLVASVSENQRGEVLETSYARQLTSGGGKPGQGFAAARVGSSVRRLTPVECERLQGFPDGWTLPAGPSLAREPSFPHRTDESCPPPDGPRYAAMGDAVTVPVIEWIGRRISGYLMAELDARVAA